MTTLQCDAVLAALPMSAPALSSEPEDGDNFTQLQAFLGGPGAVNELLEGNSSQEIEYTLSLFGIGYARPDDDAQADASFARNKPVACPQKLPPDSVLHIDGGHYFADSYGRPSHAYIELPPIAMALRSKNCQGKVGSWGQEEHPGLDYDGGHMIGAQIRGWRGRENTIAQQKEFNQGPWSWMENAMADCSNLADKRFLYSVAVDYRSGDIFAPDRIHLSIEDKLTHDHVEVSFPNTLNGGNGWEGKVCEVQTFLAESGCSDNRSEECKERPVDRRSDRARPGEAKRADEARTQDRRPEERRPEGKPRGRDAEPSEPVDWIDIGVRSILWMREVVRDILVAPSEKEKHR